MTEEIKKDIDLKEPEIKEEVKSKSVKKREAISKAVEPKLVVNKGYYVCSRLNHPAELKYSGKSFMIAPRGKVWVEDKNLVSNIPNGVYIREIV